MKNKDKEIYDLLISKVGCEKLSKLKKNKASFDSLKNFVHALNNKRRSEIERLLTKSPRTITELSKHFNIDYKAVWKHVMILEKAGIVILEKDEHKKGRPVKAYHANFYKTHKEQEKQENSNK